MRQRKSAVTKSKKRQSSDGKLARYGNPNGASTLKTKADQIKTAWMGQSVRSRYLKTGGILLFIVFLFYYIAPKAETVPSEYSGGHVGGVLLLRKQCSSSILTTE